MKHLIEIKRYLSYRLSPDNILWAFDAPSDTWYCLSPAGEHWQSRDHGAQLPNEVVSKLGWPEVKFDVDSRQWTLLNGHF
jgi:hypothetical protein